MKKYFVKKSGQGMIEMIAAIGILLLIASAILGMAVSNIKSQKSTELYVVANNLAREAIEVTRNIRDSNWLAGEKWNTQLNTGEAITVLSFNDLGDPVWNLQYDPAVPAKAIYQAINGLYSHDNAGAPTIYSRLISIEAICHDDISEEQIKSDCEAGENQIGIKVSALVTWDERGAFRQVLIEDLLYDWK